MELRGLEVRQALDGSEIEAARLVRLKVFVEEQGVSEELEVDDLDGVATHVVAFANGEVVGTGRALRDGHLGRIAVVESQRGLGVGSEIVRLLTRIAMDSNAERAWLFAQLSAVGFYEKLGFSVCGAAFLEAGIEHVEMEMRRSS